MLGMRSGATMRNVPAHHGVDLSRNNLVKQVREAAASDEGDSWTPPVLRTVAVKDEGIDELVAALDRHFRYLERSGRLRERRRARLRERVIEVVEDKTRRRLWSDATTNAWLEERLPELETGQATPFGIADALLARSADLLTRTTP
jgi:LAO/AO transport system kinase